MNFFEKCGIIKEYLGKSPRYQEAKNKKGVIMMTYAEKKGREVPAKDYLPSRAAFIHPALVIAPPTTPLGEFSLIFLQNATEETLRTIYDECEFQGSPRVSLTFCKTSSTTSHAKVVLDDKKIEGINPQHTSCRVLRYTQCEYAHYTSYHCVCVAVI